MKKFREVAEMMGEFVELCLDRYNLKVGEEGKSSNWQRKKRE